MNSFGDINLNLKESDLEDIFKEKTNYTKEDLEIIKNIIIELSKHDYINKKHYTQTMNSVIKLHIANLPKFPSKIELNIIYRRLKIAGIITPNVSLEKFMKRKFGRSGSGELPVAVFTSPSKFDCPEDCQFCPDEKVEKEFTNPKTGKTFTKKVRIQPRSYLSTEPGCMRAAKDKFHPITQTYDRIHCLEIMGHEPDKIRFIVLGGTYCYYPMDYRIWYMTCLYYACNTYNSWSRRRIMKTLEEEMQLNRISDVRVVGITIETRPDHCSLEDCAHFMSCGITTVQIGIQQLDDAILKGINRGCTVEQIRTGTKRILDCGIKLDTHYMFDLPGPGKLCRLSPEDDRNMIDMITEDEDFAIADQWKLYPCSTTPHTKILVWYNNMREFMTALKQKINIIRLQRTWRKNKNKIYSGLGGGDPIDLSKKKYLPYAEIDGGSYLVDTLIYAKQKVHKDTRLNRVIRDIPDISIVGGNKITNLRQHVLAKIEKEGLKKCACIRCREIQGGEFNVDDLTLDVYTRHKAGSDDHFISFEDSSGKIYALARLRFLNESSDCLPLLENSAIIREVHVYGAIVKTNSADPTKPQHSGLGTKLVKKCEEMAKVAGYNKIFITSGEGVINYYKDKLGYSVVYDDYNGTKYHYMMKSLETQMVCPSFWNKVLRYGGYIVMGLFLGIYSNIYLNLGYEVYVIIMFSLLVYGLILNTFNYTSEYI
uniref:tRNA carboxymethyluridine synthase n=1 Tax=viral metagenome TaxID=1070528 RepID=A0A6C0EJ69_9ZZZZ